MNPHKDSQHTSSNKLIKTIKFDMSSPPHFKWLCSAADQNDINGITYKVNRIKIGTSLVSFLPKVNSSLYASYINQN